MEATKKTERGRPRTRESLPPEDQKKTQVLYCSDKELAELKRVLEGWRQQEKIKADKLIV